MSKSEVQSGITGYAAVSYFWTQSRRRLIAAGCPGLDDDLRVIAAGRWMVQHAEKLQAVLRTGADAPESRQSSEAGIGRMRMASMAKRKEADRPVYKT